ncbi:hypothetical protein [Spirosoma sordidisoli]|uniref:Uncharacterized protein n=1 Tax=Spirosoma sordidisoli TaxID=2502893 RepID=A0A4Q2UR12_9BACT|nr:hypothetical protein [Spirosoma sordidisoli]RYC70090.1 hypothetical protein EQG79_09470 [Spirosoma sordidisoli]
MAFAQKRLASLRAGPSGSGLTHQRVCLPTFVFGTAVPYARQRGRSSYLLAIGRFAFVRRSSSLPRPSLPPRLRLRSLSGISTVQAGIWGGVGGGRLAAFPAPSSVRLRFWLVSLFALA